MRARYFVTTGFGRGPHVLAFLGAAHARGIAPDAIITVRQFSVSNLRALQRRTGGRQLAAKLAKSMRGLFGPSLGSDEETSAVIKWTRTHALTVPGSVSAACRRFGIPRHRTSSLSSPSVCGWLRNQSFDFGVYLSGGILSREFIASVRGPILNAHQGPLPQVRGMNAVEWSVYLGLVPTVTVHAIEPGIDTGPICLDRQIDRDSYATLAELRGASTVAGIELLLEAVEMLPRGQLQWRQQRADDGRQFFAMHEFLLERTVTRLRAMNGNKWS